jgi:hypothetical protein
MLLVYAIMMLAVIGVGGGIAHLVDPHHGGVHGTWVADDYYCDGDGCLWFGTFTAPSGDVASTVWIDGDAPAHLRVGTSLEAWFHDGGDDGQWVEFPHPVSGWWLVLPSVLVLAGAVAGWRRLDRRRGTGWRRLDRRRGAGTGPVPTSFKVISVLTLIGAAGGVIELVELRWPGHGWHYGRLWGLPVAMAGTVLIDRVAERRYGADRVAADRARDRKRWTGVRMWWAVLLTVLCGVLALAVAVDSMLINDLTINRLSDGWPDAGAVAFTVALALGIAALGRRLSRTGRAPEDDPAADASTAVTAGNTTAVDQGLFVNPVVRVRS